LASNLLTDVIARFGRKYLWWRPVDGQPFSEARIILQTMNHGTHDNTLLLEQMVGGSRLVEVLRHAEPGCINDRSWEFWHRRWLFATGAAIPDKPPRRAFL
jgi:hypothetical protein